MCSSEYCFQSLCSILWWLWIKAPLMTNGGIWLCSDDSSEKDNCGHISITKNAKGNLFCFAVLQKTLGFLKTQKGESGLFTWSWTCYLYLFKIKVVTFLAEDLTPCSWSENSWRIKTAPSMTHQMPEEFSFHIHGFHMWASLSLLCLNYGIKIPIHLFKWLRTLLMILCVRQKHVYMCEHVGICICVHVNMALRGQHWVSSSFFPLHYL